MAVRDIVAKALEVNEQYEYFQSIQERKAAIQNRIALGQNALSAVNAELDAEQAKLLALVQELKTLTNA
jgi:hypothetical protein